MTFSRRPEVIHRLCEDAAPLLSPFLDGLIWRSRVAVRGQRRLNCYVKHLIQDSEGKLNNALMWLSDNKDPKVITHPTVVLFADLIWNRVASPFFLQGLAIRSHAPDSCVEWV